MAARGYRGLYLARQWGEGVQGPPEGVALFVRQSAFELLDFRKVTFSLGGAAASSGLAALSSDAEDAPPSAQEAPVRDATATEEEEEGDEDVVADAGMSARRGRRSFLSVFQRRKEGAILALLQQRGTGRRLAAAVTHIYWSPAFPDVKAVQAATLCRELAAFVEEHGADAAGAIPLVLAGDFNSLPRKHVPDAFDPQLPRQGLVSGVYTLLTRGVLEPSHPDHPTTRRRLDARAPLPALTSAGLRFDSAYCVANGSEPPLTTRTDSFAGCLDYIFLSAQDFEVESTLELPYAATAARDPLSEVDFPPIPNDVYPSDHLAVAAVLRLRDARGSQRRV